MVGAKYLHESREMRDKKPMKGQQRTHSQQNECICEQTTAEKATAVAADRRGFDKDEKEIFMPEILSYLLYTLHNNNNFIFKTY